MNRLLNQKKVISDNKFNRLFANNLSQAGVAYVTDKQWNTRNSLQAIRIGNFVYCRFPCANQPANRLKCYNVRYDLDNPLDFVMFQPYATPVFAPVEF